jgi:predicted SAM-dependent methyltransferase
MKPRLVRVIGRSIRDDFRVLHSELERLWQNRSRTRSAFIRAYLDSHEVRCLHIGSGGNVLQGWLNTDLNPRSDQIIYLDATDPLPFEDSTLDYVFSEHLIEHLPHEDGAYHLNQCYRVLKPKGRIRVATPDLQFLIEIYTQSTLTEPQAKYVRRTLDRAFPNTGFFNGAFVLNHFMRHWGHKFIYDEATLGHALRKAGFTETRRWPVGDSDEPRLRDIEHHGDAISEEFNLLQTMVIEGAKPSR